MRTLLTESQPYRERHRSCRVRFVTVTAITNGASTGAVVNVTANGTWTYDPRSADRAGLAVGQSATDTFTYTILMATAGPLPVL